jgi:hypothetical protein
VADVANKPSMVAIMELAEAMIRLVAVALRNSSAAPNDLNQSNVKPDNGNAMMLLSLKAKIGKRRVGAYRKITKMIMNAVRIRVLMLRPPLSDSDD